MALSAFYEIANFSILDLSDNADKRQEVAESINEILVKNGLALLEYLKALDEQYEANTKDWTADEILKM